jgi:hypothetical protein
MNIRYILEKLYFNRFAGGLFHTVDYCIMKNLKQCDSVLDLGCGSNSPVRRCSNLKHKIGIEGYAPYLEESKSKGIHTNYILGNIMDQSFPKKSFDAVLMLEVLEHLSKEDGLRMLAKIEQWARKVIIISAPNGFLPQNAIDGNQYQKHLSGWRTYEFKTRGYKVFGLSGLKLLRTERAEGEEHDTIRFKPKIFWAMVAIISQIVTYFVPLLAFECLYVKTFREEKSS